MYKLSQSDYIYSPSDLILYMSSPFASWMERLKIDHPEKVEGIPRDQDAMLSLLAEKGNVHEANYLAYLIAQHGKENVAIIERDTATASKKTMAAMVQGHAIIFQAYLERDNRLWVIITMKHGTPSFRKQPDHISLFSSVATVGC